MDQERKDRHFNRFLSPPLPKDATIVSQCGQYQMQSPGRVQRKPHQMVTPRNERTSSKKGLKSATASSKKSDDKECDEVADLPENDSESKDDNPLASFLSQDNILQGKFGKANKQKLIDSQKAKSKEGPKRKRGRPRKDQSNKEN